MGPDDLLDLVNLPWISIPSGMEEGGGGNRNTPTAAWLAQLVERQSAVREVEGSSPRPDQHSES